MRANCAQRTAQYAGVKTGLDTCCVAYKGHR